MDVLIALRDEPIISKASTLINTVSFPTKSTSPTDSVHAGDLEDPNAKFAAEIRGKTLRIPNHVLTSLSDAGWPTVEIKAAKWTPGQRAQYERLRRDTDAVIARIFKDPVTVQKVKDEDYALFCFAWFLQTEDYENLWTATLYIIWLFVWDDQVDLNEGSLASDFASATAWRTETIAMIDRFFGLKATPAAQALVTGPMIALEEFSKRAVKKFNEGQLRRLRDEMVRFIEACGTEQASRLAGYVPGVDEYHELRPYTSSVYSCFVILEVFSDVPLPDWVWDSREMKIIAKEGNSLVYILNDVLSLKKEIANNCVINTVPVMYLSGVPWERIMPELEADIEKSRKNLDDAAQVLIEGTMSEPDVNRAMIHFIDGVKNNTTGNISYSLDTARYRNMRTVTDDDMVEIAL
ncbi:isoprenoid synthase domain-containing protein [Podospora didyma]|uniref:Terpene synthase n=1 Tax=Podospora didyma TaxID=330526 RepID=A0AAE0NWZ0_9PEZI|nr:isoprenoid synthase domain-containing protein [Podospora didyma]